GDGGMGWRTFESRIAGPRGTSDVSSVACESSRSAKPLEQDPPGVESFRGVPRKSPVLYAHRRPAVSVSPTRDAAKHLRPIGRPGRTARRSGARGCFGLAWWEPWLFPHPREGARSDSFWNRLHGT